MYYSIHSSTRFPSSSEHVPWGCRQSGAHGQLTAYFPVEGHGTVEHHHQCVPRSIPAALVLSKAVLDLVLCKPLLLHYKKRKIEEENCRRQLWKKSIAKVTFLQPSFWALWEVLPKLDLYEVRALLFWPFFSLFLVLLSTLNRYCWGHPMWQV